jgi:hypothetical protein
MIRSQAVEIVSRRLGLNAGRTAALVRRAADGGLLPKANGRDIPDLGSLEVGRLFLACVVDNGLGNAARSVQEFSALHTDHGVNLLDVLDGLIAGRIPATSIRSAIFQLRPAGVVLISEAHLRFGAPPSTDGAAKPSLCPATLWRRSCWNFRAYHYRKQMSSLRSAGSRTHSTKGRK